jgi:hypothetical protein
MLFFSSFSGDKLQKRENNYSSPEGAVGEAMTQGAREKANMKGGLDNNTYDLIEQLNIENKSLWRIKNNYKTDAQSANCQDCKEFWDKIEKQKQQNIKDLTNLLRKQQWTPK